MLPMQQHKTIKIFLASSVIELKEERLKLADYINNTIAPILAKGGMAVRLFKCEDNHSGNFGESSQNEIDEELKNSDVSVFLFKKKAGEKTLREFDLARKLQKTKRHEIYVYCFEVHEKEKSEGLIAFQQRLENEEFYWKTCNDIGSLESLFLPGLLRHVFGEKAVSDAERESEIERDGDARFKQYEDNERIQTQLRERIHRDIDGLLQQIKIVMSDESINIALRITKAVELYKKADYWAGKTDYDNEKCINLLSEFARFMDGYGMYKDAEAIFLRLIPITEALYGIESDENIALLNNIGSVYWEQGKNSEAIGCYEKAVVMLERKHGFDHPTTATYYNNIGTVYDHLDDYTKALEYYEKALKIIEKYTEMELSETVMALYNNIGVIYRKTKDYTRSLEYLFSALEMCENTYGEWHPYTATTCNTIGEVFVELGDYDKALEYHIKALNIDETCFGSWHPDVGRDYNDIGYVYANKNDFHVALDYYAKALEINKGTLGEGHPNTAICYNNIGYVYLRINEYDRALEYLIKAMDIRQNTLGPNHPETRATEELLVGVRTAMANGKVGH